MRDRISVLEDGVDRGLNVSVLSDLYHHHHHREVLSRVVQTHELITLVCVMFGLLSDSLIGILEGDLLGRFRRVANPSSVDSHYT